ncbi:phosphoenolpyruvate--protein phosphotransferase [Cytobacillus dafuensis]|uniref:Phosphoenolpyruvate-protein phosphotransferase n=1 Tax=Cytobacillus dafuensis TaxID=1742359 RepID=A0A5B8Z1F2_CYTDA|nr:phosphoenolpyruvate--protein phosphotransferase [Cytobacillus dafuensis]QED46844.1 phosphoenolpyruvate--protein phosphotransferase [Cytobacillus dafuensis]
MLEINGISISKGITLAPAYCLAEPDLSFDKVKITHVDSEIDRLKEAMAKTKLDLIAIRDAAMYKFGEEKAEIFSAHLLILEDPEIFSAIEAKINEKMNAESALDEVCIMYSCMFESMDNDYMKERAADIRDVCKRILAHLLHVELPDYSRISREVIIVAEDLTPSMTAQLDKQFVRGFVTDIGGRTSHSAILARAMGIPAIVGTKNASKNITNGSPLIIDGLKGKVIVNATEDVQARYRASSKELEKDNELLKKYITLPSISADGHIVEIAGNIGNPNDVDAIIANGGDGIGLFRTEFLFMDRMELPTEEEQFDAYKTVLSKMDGKPTVVRTLDIGGDKELPYLKLPAEINPFLGYRAIRLCLDQQSIFRTQLRALLRASMYGNLKIMFPMIATLDEFRRAKAILLEEKQKLLDGGALVNDQIEIGMMVEIPSAAVIADLFAQEADFLSIGTNDLIQYTLAADRMNEKISYLYQPYHPAVLRLIKMVIDAAHNHGKWVGMCGEMAGDEVAIPILLALGLDEFSMSSASILKTRGQISKLNKDQLNDQLEHILQLKTSIEVELYVKKYFLNLK